MSPISPISPLSPMDISPITLASPLSPSSIIDLSLHPNSELTIPSIPPTPVICPSIHLPRLKTDLPIASRHHRRMTSSSRFVLLTPSPLALNGNSPSSLYSSPRTAVLVPVQGRAFGIVTSPHSSVLSTPSSGMSSSLNMDILPGTSPTSSTSSGSPGQTPIRSPMVGNMMRRTVRNTPSLKRENAMERLERMCVDMEMEAEVEIPVVPSPTSAQQQITPPNKSTTIPVTARPPTRSPIHRHSHRRRTTLPTPTTTTKTHIAHPTQTLSTVATYLAHPLVPLISISTGLPHLSFPRTLLHYHLLTHDDLDALARHYHQTLGAGRERWMYPCPIGWGRAWCGDSAATTSAASGSIANGRKRRRLADLETKRRRWGRFIGLRGCESPVDAGGDGDDGEVRIRVGNEGEQEQGDGEGLVARMEREWRDALRRAEEEGRVREKIWGRRF